MEASANIHTPLSDSENNIAPHVILDLRAQAKSLEFSSDGHLFAASCNCEAALWDAKTFSLICNLDVPSNEGPLYTSFTPDGRAIWLASEEGIIARHGILSYAHNIPPIRTSYTISCIKSSPDGMYLAVAIKSSATLLDSTTSDAHDVKSSVKLYDCMGQELATLVAGGSDDYICSLSFTADGERLTGISEDGAMFVWDTDSRTLVAGPFPQPAPAFQVAYSLGNDLVASAGPTGQIKVWKKHIGQEKVTPHIT
ncbi:WD40 repeat-like protein [Coniophora puteana RWD-64-598 SS2]|uniref:WD40 repeat-like protein n=1 Tax=Coniophora puteana (strain RWD-64-598) TaxID=741705 RepID=A0A5M3MXV1_CONPW|nr:WD40 repeat-like protein [Coniophora puteana RWD-64-598 SS2]EIW83929.1 WD40 repeat-like protein [Coniophora puteana RWD-64-598 SS2]